MSDDLEVESVERSAVEAAVCQGRDPGWEELLELAGQVGPCPDLAALDDAALERRLRTGAARLAAQMCRWLDLVAELVVRGVWADQGATTPAVWLSWAVGMSPSAARDRVRVALRLRELGRVRAEFAAGRISYSKVRAITRVAIPETEELLLRWASEATGAEMERIVTGFRAAQRGVMAGPESQEAARTVLLRHRGDGTAEVVFRMPTDEAHALYAAGDRLIDLEDGASASAESGVGTSASAESGVGASASAESAVGPGIDLDPDASARSMAAQGDRAGPATVAGPQPTQRPRAARMTEAVLHALQAAVAAGTPDTSGLDRDTLVVHVADHDLEAPDRCSAPGVSTGTVAVDTRQGHIPALASRVLRRMACEAGLVLVATDPSGTPVDVGRRDRRLSTALRRALHDRDRSCRFPGCGARRHLHGHHIHHWADGGPTDLGNLVLLCSFHHRYVHDHDVDVLLRRGAAHEFRRPDGRRIARSRPLPDPHVEGPPSGTCSQPVAPDPRGLEPDHWDGRYSLDTTVAVLQQQLHAVLPHTAGTLAA